MPSWNDLANEIQELGGSFDVIRRRYLKELSEYTDRNTILYYSGWLQKPGVQGAEVNDSDKNGFMATIHNLDKSKGLDLILHTPGGDIAATESLVDYLRQMFGNNVRAIVPQLAMSAGTMIACSTQSILMGNQSSLGPIDPQFGGISAHGLVEEFKRAKQEIMDNPSLIPVWQPILARYNPTLVGDCEKAIEWANEMVAQWLSDSMLSNQTDPLASGKAIVAELASHDVTKSHARHYSAKSCEAFGLSIEYLERDRKLQDLVLSVHHACIHTLTSTPALKIIENQNGVAFIQMGLPNLQLK